METLPTELVERVLGILLARGDFAAYAGAARTCTHWARVARTMPPAQALGAALRTHAPAVVHALARKRLQKRDYKAWAFAAALLVASGRMRAARFFIEHFGVTGSELARAFAARSALLVEVLCRHGSLDALRLVCEHAWPDFLIAQHAATCAAIYGLRERAPMLGYAGGREALFVALEAGHIAAARYIFSHRNRAALPPLVPLAPALALAPALVPASTLVLTPTTAPPRPADADCVALLLDALCHQSEFSAAQAEFARTLLGLSDEALAPLVAAPRLWWHGRADAVAWLAQRGARLTAAHVGADALDLARGAAASGARALLELAMPLLAPPQMRGAADGLFLTAAMARNAHAVCTLWAHCYAGERLGRRAALLVNALHVATHAHADPHALYVQTLAEHRTAPRKRKQHFAAARYWLTTAQGERFVLENFLEKRPSTIYPHLWARVADATLGAETADALVAIYAALPPKERRLEVWRLCAVARDAPWRVDVSGVAETLVFAPPPLVEAFGEAEDADVDE
jgi:hypothetical protein